MRVLTHCSSSRTLHILQFAWHVEAGLAVKYLFCYFIQQGTFNWFGCRNGVGSECEKANQFHRLQYNNELD